MIPLSPTVLATIESYLAERNNTEGTKARGKKATVFVRTNGQPLDNRTMQRIVSNWLGNAGITAPAGEKVHLFRHTYAMAQIQAGTSLVELQALLGHVSAATTAIYLRISPEHLHHTATATSVDTRLADDLASGRWDQRHGHLRSQPQADYGYRLILAG